MSRLPSIAPDRDPGKRLGALGNSELADIGWDCRGRQRVFFLLTFFAMPLFLVGRLAVQHYWPAGNGLDTTGYQIGRDFINVWAAPRIAFGPHVEQLLDLNAYHAEIGRLFGHPLEFHSWSYPLNALLWYWPFSLPPYFTALALWTLLGLAAFALVAMNIVAPGRRLLAVALLAVAPATLMNAIGGQNGFFTAALLVGALLSLDTRPVLAGVLLGVLSFKPQLLLALPLVLVALGAWRTIVTATAVTAASVALTVGLIGTEPWLTYLTQTRHFQMFALQVEPFADFYTLWMSSVAGAARAAGLAYAPAMVLQVVVAVPVLLAAAWAVTRTSDARLRTFAVVSATPLVSPYIMSYDLTAVALILVWYLTDSVRVERRHGMIVFLAWLTPIITLYMQRLGIPFAPLVHIALFAVAVRAASRDAAAQALTPRGWLERSRHELQALLGAPSAVAAWLGRSPAPPRAAR